MRTTRRTNVLGFSLIELMVVIAIIAILAGLMAAALPGIQNTINRNNTKAFLAEIEGGLESYEIDNGIFPQNRVSASRVESGIEGSQVLYKSLSGDRDLDGSVDIDDDTKVYVERLSWTQNEESSKPRSFSDGNNYYVIDTFASPVFYLAEPPNIDPSERKTFNPTYDLWSTAGKGTEDEEDEASWITNWQSK